MIEPCCSLLSYSLLDAHLFFWHCSHWCWSFLARQKKSLDLSAGRRNYWLFYFVIKSFTMKDFLLNGNDHILLSEFFWCYRCRMILEPKKQTHHIRCFNLNIIKIKVALYEWHASSWKFYSGLFQMITGRKCLETRNMIHVFFFLLLLMVLNVSLLLLPSTIL